MTDREILRTLANYLEETHREEIDNDHYGDDREQCSYCQAIKAARELLATKTEPLKIVIEMTQSVHAIVCNHPDWTENDIRFAIINQSNITPGSVGAPGFTPVTVAYDGGQCFQDGWLYEELLISRAGKTAVWEIGKSGFNNHPDVHYVDDVFDIVDRNRKDGDE